MEILSGRVLIHPVDHARSLAFYRDVLQLAVYREFPGGTVFFLGGGYLEVSGGHEAGSGAEERVLLWLQVRDLHAAYRELLARGATVVREPRREPWGLDEMWLADPDGIQVRIVEVPPEHPIRRDPRT